jgi:hypothetical protein
LAFLPAASPVYEFLGAGYLLMKSIRQSPVQASGCAASGRSGGRRSTCAYEFAVDLRDVPGSDAQAGHLECFAIVGYLGGNAVRAVAREDAGEPWSDGAKTVGWFGAGYY